jgi:hypothetical protein
MLLAPPRGGKKRNLSSILKARSVTDHLPDPILRTTKQRSAKSDLASLAANVTSKIEDGNIKAALRLLSSDDRPASDNDATIVALQARHPPAAPEGRTNAPPPFGHLPPGTYAPRTNAPQDICPSRTSAPQDKSPPL